MSLLALDAATELDMFVERIKAVLKLTYPPSWSLHFPGRQNPALYYVAQGVFTIQAGREVHAVEAGHVVSFHAGDVVTLSNQGPQPLTLFQFTFWLAESSFVGRGVDIPFCVEDNDNRRYLSAFVQAHQVFTLQPAAYRLKLRSILENLLFALINDHMTAGCAAVMDERMARVFEHIHAHYMREVSLSSLCRLACLSASQLRAQFHRALGMSPTQYIRKIRLQRARELLLVRDMPIWLVAEQTGFQDASYFCRVFKADAGISPAAYREMEATRWAAMPGR